MNTEREIDDILLSLNPTVKKCNTCDRYYNNELQKPFLKTIQTCFNCWSMTFLSVNIYDKYGREYIEKLFYDRYDIVLCDKLGETRLRFQQKKKDEKRT